MSNRVGAALALLGAALAIIWVASQYSQAPAEYATLDEALRSVPPAEYGPPERWRVEAPEGTTPFVQRPYDPAWRVPFIRIQPRNNQLLSPEALLVSMASSGKAADYRWWLSLWDRQSQAKWARMVERGDLDPDAMRANWKDIYADGTILLTHRMDVEGYTFVSFASAENIDNLTKPNPPVAMKRAPNGSWWLTLELSDTQLHGALAGLKVGKVLRD